MGLAIITGGSRGLGAALCDVYRERGWGVLEFSRSAPHSFSVGLDLSDSYDSASVFEEAFKSLDVVHPAEVVAISNAAVLEPIGPTEHASPAQIASHIDANVISAILFARSFVGTFQEHDCPKTFVNISSGAATRGYAGWSMYCASKAAMENYVRAVALEQANRSHPIRAISINPGVMDTAMQATVRESSVEDFPTLERFVRLEQDGLLAPPTIVAARIAEMISAKPEPGGVYSADSGSRGHG